jgi:hypothetical protein
MLEAMSCGLPVLGAKVKGIKDTIQHGENGWLCETDVDSIHDALEILLADPELRSRLGQNSRLFAVEHFDLEKVFQKEISLMSNLVKSRPAMVKQFFFQQVCSGLHGWLISTVYRAWVNLRGAFKSFS